MTAGDDLLVASGYLERRDATLELTPRNGSRAGLVALTTIREQWKEEAR